MFWTSGLASSEAMASSTATRKPGSATVRPFALCTSTVSAAGCVKPASRILSTWPDSPGPEVASSIVSVPI